MTDQPPPPTRWRPWVLAGIVFVLAFDVIWLWQRFGGAQSSELGGHPHEAAKFLTALTVHDYLSAGAPAGLPEFLSNHATHYAGVEQEVPPRLDVALTGLWMMASGAGRIPALFLNAFMAALVAALLFFSLRRSLSGALATLAAAGWLLLPRSMEWVQLAGAAALPDLLLLGAAAAFGWFLDTEKNAAGLLWGFCAAGGLLTDMSGTAALAIAPAAVLLTQRWSLLRRPGLWLGALAAGTAALVALPALVRSVGEASDWDGPRPGVIDAAIFQAGGFGFALGGLFAVFFIVGLAGRLHRQETGGFWLPAAVGLAALGVLSVVPALPLTADRLTPGLPLAMAFVAAGIERMRLGLRRRRGIATGGPTAIETVLAIVLIAGGLFVAHRSAPVREKSWSGFGPIAEHIAGHPAAETATILICSDRQGEAMFAAEIALRDGRPGRKVQTVAQAISRRDRGASQPRPRFDTEDELSEWLPRSGIDFVLIDPSMAELERTQSHDQIMRVCERSVDKVWPVANAPFARPGIEVPLDLKLFEVRRERR